MSNYRPGTLDDNAYNARRDEEQRRVIGAAAMPTGGQTNDLAGRVAQLQESNARLTDVCAATEEKAAAALQDASTAREAAESASVDAAIAIEMAQMQVGSVVMMDSDSSPDRYGTWESIGSFSVGDGETAQTLYLFRRIDDDDS